MPFTYCSYLEWLVIIFVIDVVTCYKHLAHNSFHIWLWKAGTETLQTTFLLCQLVSHSVLPLSGTKRRQEQERGHITLSVGLLVLIESLLQLGPASSFFWHLYNQLSMSNWAMPFSKLLNSHKLFLLYFSLDPSLFFGLFCFCCSCAFNSTTSVWPFTCIQFPLLKYLEKFIFPSLAPNW